MGEIRIQEGGPPPPIRPRFSPLKRLMDELIPSERQIQTGRPMPLGVNIDIFDPDWRIERWIDECLIPTWVRDSEPPQRIGMILLQLLPEAEINRVLSKVPAEGVDAAFWVGCGLAAQAAKPSSDASPIWYGDLHIHPRDLIDICVCFMDQGVVGASPPMVRTYHELLKIADSTKRFPDSRLNVLVTGEIGSGKSLLAETLSKIADRNKVLRVNCGAFSRADLLSSELFGHVKGTFTGASRNRNGLIEAAKHGTVVLDDIDKMPMESQGHFLQVLNGGRYKKLGEDKSRVADDVFFIATTNADLNELVESGDFLPDLYSRFNAPVNIPSLGELVQDVPLFVRHFLKPFAGSVADKYRFPIAEWYTQQVEAGHVNNIRELGQHVIPALARHLEGRMSAPRNPVRSQVMHALDPSTAIDTPENPHRAALQAAVEKAVSKGSSRPVQLEKVAPFVTLGLKTGYTSQSLLGPPWREHLDQLRAEGEINPGRN